MTKHELDILHRYFLNHTRTSIEYAISVLEDIRHCWVMGSDNRSRLDNKIEELKKLLQA
jgi:hypothetical protein